MPDRHRGRRHLPEGEEEFCHYCNKALRSRRDRTVDHIVPASLGGRDERWNYQLSCRKCNESKGSTWPTCKCNKCRKSVRIHWQAYKIKPPKAP